MKSTSYSLAAMTRRFLELGTIGFGGPVALVGYMYRDLEARGLIGEDALGTFVAGAAVVGLLAFSGLHR